MGRVIDALTQQGLAGAVVTIARGPSLPGQPMRPSVPFTSVRLLTDHEGRFVVANLPPGPFTLSATKSGYATGAYGRRVPMRLVGPSLGQSITLAEGERKGNLSIPLWRFGVIGGRVLDEAGEPLIGVQVRVLHSAIVAGRRKFAQLGTMPTTDDRGVYRLASLIPGDYIVAIVSTQATVPAAVFDAVSAERRSGDSMNVSRALEATGASVPYTAGLRVGELMLLPEGGMFSGAMATRPPARDGRVFVYPSVFYPSASTPAQAEAITLGPGEERTNVDFQLRPMPTSRLSGTVVSPDGDAARIGVSLLAVANEVLSRETGNETATTVSDDTGAFTFLGVPPGRYILRAAKVPRRPAVSPGFSQVIQVGSSTIMSGGGLGEAPPISDEPTYWATLPVTVGERDVSGVTVSLRRGARLAGRAEFIGAATKPAGDRLRQITITVEAADGRSGFDFGLSQIFRGQIAPDGSFKTYQLPGGRYLLRPPAAPPGWTFKSAMVNGRDMSDVPLELSDTDVDDVVLTFTDRLTEFGGAVRTSRGTPDDAASVLLFPADRARWVDGGASPRRLAIVRAGTDGTFSFPRVVAGEYYVVAVPEEATDNWQDPVNLAAFAKAASRITLTDGATLRQDLTTAVIR
jgi:hypothetical protein